MSFCLGVIVCIVGPFFVRNLLIESGTAGNLASDAHLAAIAIEHGGAICSTDHDFLRFPGVRLINPIREGT